MNRSSGKFSDRLEEVIDGIELAGLGGPICGASADVLQIHEPVPTDGFVEGDAMGLGGGEIFDAAEGPGGGPRNALGNI